MDLWVFWQWWWICGFLWVAGGGRFSCSGYRVVILVVSGGGGGSYCKSVKEKREEREMKRKRD